MESTKEPSKVKGKLLLLLFLSALVLSLIVVLVPIFVGGKSAINCVVTEDASGQEKKCKFPFKFREQVFHECTEEDALPGKFWCSTKTDGSGNHVERGGFWGFCNETCMAGSEEDFEELFASYGNEPRSGLQDINTQQDCPCKSYQDCPDVLRQLKEATKLTKGDGKRERIVADLRNLVCKDQGTAGRPSTFHCCSPEMAEERILALPDEMFKNKTGSIVGDEVAEDATENVRARSYPDDDWNLGTWKPQPGECGVSIFSSHVVGGREARPGEFPFMALLGYLVNGRIKYICGGTLINRHYVLTAAHCVTGQYKPRELVFGEHDLGSDRDCEVRTGTCLPKPQKRFPAAGGIIIHDGWDESNFRQGNDIALIRLDRPVDTFIEDPTNTDNTILAPVCLPWDRNSPARQITENESLWVAGWGAVTNILKLTRANFLKYHASSQFLMKLKIPLATEDTCKKEFSEFNSSLQYCAGGTKGEDSCSGDSGGPLLYRQGMDALYQVGITSYGTKKCGKGAPAVYTKVSAYLDWIEDNLKP